MPYKSLTFCALFLGGLALSVSCTPRHRLTPEERFLLLYTERMDAKRTRAWSLATQELLDMPAPPADWRPFAPHASGPPPDDAEEEIFVTWWAAIKDGILRHRPSDKAQQRVQALLPRYPEFIGNLLHELPYTDEAYELVAALVAKERARPDSAIPARWNNTINHWLGYRAPTPLDELRAAVRNASKSPESSHADGDSEMKELLRRRPAEALPLLEKHAAGDKIELVAWAKEALLKHANETGDQARFDQLRAQLRPLAENPETPSWARYKAISALMDHDWPGRDQWFLSLLFDPTLVDLREGAMLLPVVEWELKEEPERLAPLLLPLVGHEQDHVHVLAIRALSHLERPDVLVALAPWVGDPLWARSNNVRWDYFYRRRLLKQYGKIRIPEAVPHLIKVVQSGSSKERGMAATALADLYRASDAVPALRAALDEPHYHEGRLAIVRALAILNGADADELRDGLRSYAILSVTKEDKRRLKQALGGQIAEPFLVKVCMGMVAATEFSRLPGPVADELARGALAALAWLGDPGRNTAARRLLEIISGWSHPVIMRHVLTGWSAGRVDSKLVPNVLALRTDYAREVSMELRAMVARGDAQAGIAAVMLGDEGVLRTVITGRDKPAQRTALAAARLARLPMPISDVAHLLTHEDKSLVTAAERYLVSVDSRESRKVLYAHHRGELLILGAREHFAGKRGSFAEFDPFEAYEQELVARMKADPKLDEIHALMSYSKESDGQLDVVIEVRAESATLIRGDARRALTGDEWRTWSRRLADLGILDLPPLTGELGDRGVQYEFVQLTREGGRRVFMSNPGVADPASPYQRLVWRLNILR